MFKKNLILCCFVLFSSCSSLNYRINKENSIPSKPIQIASGKRMRFDLEINTDERDKFEKRTANLKRNRFFYSLLFDMRSWRVLKTVHEKPTRVNEVLLSRFYQDDLSLDIVIDEKIVNEDHARLLRIITFGIIPQKVTKEVTFDIKLKDRKTGAVSGFKKNYQIEMSFVAPVIFIPYDWNMHPLTIDKQVEVYKKLIISDLRQMFIVEG